MGSELGTLAESAAELAVLAAGRPEAAVAGRLADRLAAGDFLIAVVGEFKRGKSTLVNALVGEAVLPTGVLPLTAVATELRFGEPGARVVHLDGRAVEISRDRIVTFATERGNPENSLGVARVEVSGRWPLLEPGAVLVDTPGLASIHEHNTVAGMAALRDADGTIVVLSADAPLSDQERRLLLEVRELRSPTFFVLNKSDHLADQDLCEVRRFLADEIGKVLDTRFDLFALDARAALAAAGGGPAGSMEPGGSLGPAGMEFARFSAVLGRFVSDDLVGARLDTARRELARLGASLREGLAVERAARSITSQHLSALVERFVVEADLQRKGFDDDRTLLARDVASLRDDVGSRLVDFAGRAPRDHRAELVRTSEEAPRGRLEAELRACVESAVQESFAQYRLELISWVDDRWQQLAGDFRARVQHRVDSAREAAVALFEVPLPRHEIPELAEQRDRFSFLFVRIGSMVDPLHRAALRVVPEPTARRRAVVRAEAELASEFDKHAGRARWDIAQRLEDARRELERAMHDALSGSIDAIVQATERARRWQAEDEQHRDLEERRSGQLDRLGAKLVALAGRTA
ncbi:MAG: dynamin family protein [Acidimicrobiales bacterium]